MTARLAGKDIHRWVFACNMAPDVETLVRKWLAKTHIVLNNTPPLHAMARTDEAVEVDAHGLTPRDAVKALIKATGLNPHTNMCGWPFCLDNLDDVEDMAGGAM